MKKSFSDRALAFYKGLSLKQTLPKGIEALNPYQDPKIFSLCRAFYKKYYSDNFQRRLILGINPGRFGAGLTGIPFTDPIKLEQRCGIVNDLPKKPELSADFIHYMIDAYGGQERFYRDYFINSVSPLGFVQHGKNLNYYDSMALETSLRTFIIRSMRQLIELGIDTSVVYCLGEGDNYRYLTRLNEEEAFFGRVVPLAHPRFIMQYRRKRMEEYVNDYVDKLSNHRP